MHKNWIFPGWLSQLNFWFYKKTLFSSSDYQLANIQLDFMRQGKNEKESYYLAKLQMRTELRKKLRNLYMYEKHRLGAKFSDDRNIFDIWYDKLNKQVEQTVERVPK